LNGGSGLFDRWRTRANDIQEWPQASAPAAVGLQLWLDPQARVLRLSGPLRTALALPAHMPARLQDYVQTQSLLALEGEPADWQAHPLDLDFRAASGQTLHTRGWLVAQAEGWLLQVFDIGDLVQQQHQGQAAQQRQALAAEVSAAMRDCGLGHLAQEAGEQLRRLAWSWQATWAVLMMRGADGWTRFVHAG